MPPDSGALIDDDVIAAHERQDRGCETLHFDVADSAYHRSCVVFLGIAEAMSRNV